MTRYLLGYFYMTLNEIKNGEKWRWSIMEPDSHKKPVNERYSVGEFMFTRCKFEEKYVKN